MVVSLKVSCNWEAVTMWMDFLYSYSEIQWPAWHFEWLFDPRLILLYHVLVTWKILIY